MTLLFSFYFLFPYLLIPYLSILYNLFLILKGYSKPLEFGFMVYCLTLLSQCFHFYNFGVANDQSLHIMKKITQEFLKKKLS